MTMREASERYNIPVEILKMYEGWGLCGAVKKVMGAWQYDDADIERLSTILSLNDIGFDSGEIETYMRLLLEGESTKRERVRMLEKKRAGTLVEIHFKERQIARLDELRYGIQKARRADSEKEEQL